MTDQPYYPSAYQCSLLLLLLHRTRAKEKGTEPSRFRVSELTLRRVCCRPHLYPDFLFEVQGALLRAGWALFFADHSFGMIRLESVEKWSRLGSKRIAEDLEEVVEGDFDFDLMFGPLPVNSAAQTTNGSLGL